LGHRGTTGKLGWVTRQKPNPGHAQQFYLQRNLLCQIEAQRGTSIFRLVPGTVFGCHVLQ
jgi:hypothetical protein